MNILTPNRIIEAGDEYRNGDGWKPIPAKDIGLQIRFTPYKEVRRSTESPKPEQGSQTARQGTANPSIVGSTPTPALLCNCGNRKPGDPHDCPVHPMVTVRKPLVTPEEEEQAVRDALAAVAHLPTVISKKAHKKVFPAGVPAKGIPKKPAMSIVSGSKSEEISIPFTDLSAIPNWIGRNGTFKQTGIRLRVMKNGLVQIRPEGKRGLAKNALMEIPVADLVQVIKWLEETRFGGTSTL